MGETWRDDLAYLQDCVLGFTATDCCFCAKEVMLPLTPREREWPFKPGDEVDFPDPEPGTTDDWCSSEYKSWCFMPKRCSHSCETHMDVKLEFSPVRERYLRRMAKLWALK